jgi:hypothetical protein
VRWEPGGAVGPEFGIPRSEQIGQLTLGGSSGSAMAMLFLSTRSSLMAGPRNATGPADQLTSAEFYMLFQRWKNSRVLKSGRICSRYPVVGVSGGRRLEKWVRGGRSDPVRSPGGSPAEKHGGPVGQIAQCTGLAWADRSGGH